MAAEVATLSEDAVARARSRLHLPTRLKGAGIRRMATVRDAAFIGCMNAILPRFLTRNSGTNTPTHGFFDPQLGSVLGRGSFNANSSARQYDHFLNDAHGSDSYAAEMREAWGRLQGTDLLFNQLDAASCMWTVAIPTARTAMTPHELREVAAGYFFLPSPCLAPVVGCQIILPSTEHNPVIVDLYGDALMNLPAPGDAHWRVQHDAIADAFRDHCVHDLGIAVRREVDDLFQQAVPLGNTVPRDELKDLVPDAELSLPAFNVVTGSYDPRSLKSTLLEFKTMRYGVKYTSVPRATAVDRFERSLLGDIQRGLAARDAAWHNTEPGQKGPLRDILDMSEYTGMVFGTVGEVSKGLHRTNPTQPTGAAAAPQNPAQPFKAAAAAPNPPPPAMITTEQIQQHLEDNKALINAILEHQNQGRLQECIPYQQKLQQNLMRIRQPTKLQLLLLEVEGAARHRRVRRSQAQQTQQEALPLLPHRRTLLVRLGLARGQLKAWQVQEEVQREALRSPHPQQGRHLALQGLAARTDNQAECRAL
eukprot:jgi/Tetstr1/420365/TSEL_011484.t1